MSDIDEPTPSGPPSNKTLGDSLKAQGNDAYKKREFDAAAKLYEQAWEANHDVVYLNNLSGESERAGCAVRGRAS